MKPLVAAATAALLVTALAGCVPSDTTGPARTASETGRATSTPSATPGASTPDASTPPADATEDEPFSAAKCLEVDQSTVDAISEGLLGVTVNRAAAYLSTEFSQVYYVAVDLVGPGVEPGQAVATFATNDDPSQPGMEGVLIAVGDAARQYSDWPRAEESDFQLSADDHGVAESQACLGR